MSASGFHAKIFYDSLSCENPDGKKIINGNQFLPVVFIIFMFERKYALFIILLV